jgi:Cu+-exporting ATPase
VVKDPVCGMQVDENQAKSCSQYQGQKVCFCGESCKQKFDANPQQYMKQQTGQTRQGGGQR